MTHFAKIDLPMRSTDQQNTAIACLALTVCWLLFAFSTAKAEQLPIKIYTTADGLAQDSINRIVRDSRGFLWFCTREGLSRFDGYQFTTYTTDQGLPHNWVNDLLETRGGAYWVATGAGVCRFNPAGSPLFAPYSLAGAEASLAAQVLIEDQSGAIWCGTGFGLFRSDETPGERRFLIVDVGMPTEGEGNVVQTALADRQRSLWFGTRTSGLYRRWPDGRVDHYTTRNGLPSDRIETLLEDRGGRIWVGTPDGLCRLVDAPDPNHPAVARVYTMKDGLATNWIDALFQSSDGTLWIGSGGLSESRGSRGSGEVIGTREFRESPQLKKVGKAEGHNGRGESRAETFRTYTTANGLTSFYILAFAEDRDGNLWVGTDSGGAMKLVRSGFTSYTPSDGLAAPGVDSVFEDRAGEICTISSNGRHFINRFDGRRFSFVAPNIPRRITKLGWGNAQITFEDRSGQWWVPTGEGLFRYPAVARVEELATAHPVAVYGKGSGLPFGDVFRLYEDRHGDIWISTLSPQDNGLSRWERATQKIHTFTDSEGLPSLKTHPAAAFAEDAAGDMWIGHWGGGLSRYREGQFTLYGESDGLPRGTIRGLYADHVNRLWIAALSGLARLDDPSASQPRFIVYTTAQGLSSNDVWCITEDQLGHIYVGTGRGLDRLDPDTGDFKHYTAADGLMRGKVTCSYRDRHGVLWFASNVHGLSRLVPGPDPPQSPPPILISGLRIGGVERPVSQLGETEIGMLDLDPGQNQLSIDFVGLDFDPGDVLRYQYKLEGADRDWSQLTYQRSVNYPNVAPGTYRFVVRAVNDDGLASETPATIAFTIKPPVWRRWWFLTLAGLAAGLGIYAAFRARVARLVELERVRTRIATDLHDDIGANLSLIAMVSEVARGHIHREDQRLTEWFSTIATTSRDTVDAMSDIVWAVNPKRDQLSDLAMRMRRFAEDIFAARNVELRFGAPEAGRDLKVGADLRREVFLIFKEGINNMVRHSRCSSAEVELSVDRGWLVLRMSDDGRGFDSSETAEGNGLASMRHRAARLGGLLRVSSTCGQGTNLTLRAPLDHRGRWWKK